MLNFRNTNNLNISKVAHAEVDEVQGLSNNIHILFSVLPSETTEKQQGVRNKQHASTLTW